jgi:hypothetical protein
VVVAGLLWACWAAFVYARVRRSAGCSETGGFWNDDTRTCFYLDCRGRSGEFAVAGPGNMKCAVLQK